MFQKCGVQFSIRSFATWNLPLINNLKLIGAGNNWNKHKTAMTMMKDGLVDLKPCISERISLEEYSKGLEMARKRPVGFVKAIFVNE